MTKDLYISLLRKGSTGNEILSILDTLIEAPEANTETPQPTLQPVQFWNWHKVSARPLGFLYS